MTGFKGTHPGVIFIYFAAVIGISMASYNPIYIACSFIGGIIYYISLKKSLKGLKVFVPMIMFMAVLNPLFSHKGATILFYWGNPITLESILYGFDAAFMLLSVIIWFGCFNHIMTEDKIVYVFGRIMPKGSLIIAMFLRFVPRLKKQMKSILEGQRFMGNDIKKAGFRKKIDIGGRAVGALVSQTLEGALVTSDSMQARGYGKKGRTTYSIFEMTVRDKWRFTAIVIMAGISIAGIIMEYTEFRFYPVIYCSNVLRGIVFYISFMGLALFPAVVDCYEVAKWKSLKSKI